MSADPWTPVIALLIVWSIVGAGIGLAMVDTSCSIHPSPWERANWAQRTLLAALFGPLFVGLYIAGLIIKHLLSPPIMAVWRWLGTL